MSTAATWLRRLTVAGVVLAAASVEAATLADKLSDFVQANTSIFVVGGVADFVTPSVERLAIRGIDFPSTSTAPGFAYHFDFESSTYVREATALGPIFAERPETIGRNRLDVGFSFLWGNLDEIDGGSLGTASTGSFPLEQDGTQLDVATSLDFESFSLRTSVWSFSATYGLTDRWDVNLLLPVMYSQLDIDAVRRGIVRNAAGEVVVDLQEPVGLGADAFGPGDLLLRTKYRILDASSGKLALTLTVRTPTGNEENFQGLGDWTITPALVAGRELWRSHVHASLGFELNADDLERNRIRYALGGTLPIWRQVGMFADLVGSSGTDDDEFVIESLFPGVSPPSNGIGIRSTQSGPGGTTTVAFVPRSDVIDLALGLKMETLGRFVAFLGAIVPLTDDGLRAPVVPTGGVQLTF